MMRFRLFLCAAVAVIASASVVNGQDWSAFSAVDHRSIAAAAPAEIPEASWESFSPTVGIGASLPEPLPWGQFGEIPEIAAAKDLPTVFMLKPNFPCPGCVRMDGNKPASLPFRVEGKEDLTRQRWPAFQWTTPDGRTVTVEAGEWSTIVREWQRSQGTAPATGAASSNVDPVAKARGLIARQRGGFWTHRGTVQNHLRQHGVPETVIAAFGNYDLERLHSAIHNFGW
jgi:hypothetical protein